MAVILDDWVAAGHHVSNHTQRHLQLPDVSAAEFIADIDAAERALAPWTQAAPRRLFRHPLCHWGETPEKLSAVNAHLATRGLTPVDVTTWCYEWTWNRAWRNARDAGDSAAQAFVEERFLDFSVAQLRYDFETAQAWFGVPIILTALGHNVPFFAVMAERYLARLQAEGVEFVPLETALADPAQAAVGSVVSAEFLVLQQKLAAAAGRPMAKIAPGFEEIFAQVTRMGAGQTG